MGQYNIGRRRALGESLGRAADFYRVVARRSITQASKEVSEQWGLMGNKEERYLNETGEMLDEVVRRLKVLEKRLLK